MPSKQLMEAAAEILNGSKANSPAMPPESLAKGKDIQDLGGPTNQDANPYDDSEKLDLEKNPDNSKANKKSIQAKGSDAPVKEDYQEDIKAIFQDGTISEDFKSKAATIFEARLHDKVQTITEELEEKYAVMFEESVNQIQEDLAKKVDDYLKYVVEQWIEDNQIAIDSGLRSEISEDFIQGMKNLFMEHYIDIPDDKVDLVDELSEKVITLEDKLTESIDKNIEFQKALNEAKKVELLYVMSEGLTVTQVEKLKTLAESIEFTTEDEYKIKLETIKENYFTKTIKKTTTEELNETINDISDVIINDPVVAAVSSIISKSKNI